MKKQIKNYAIIFVILIAFSCSTEKIENDWMKDNLKGKVKSYSEATYRAESKFGKVEKGEQIFWGTQIKYDDKGNKVEANWYHSDGSLRDKTTYEYDDKGNRVESNVYHSDGSLSDKWTYEYDDKGNKVEANVYHSDGSLSDKWTYEYDDKGNRVESNWYHSDGSLRYKMTFKYDDKGNRVETNWYHSDGSLRYKTTYEYEYDSQGNWVKRIEFEDEKPESISEREYEYYD